MASELKASEAVKFRPPMSWHEMKKRRKLRDLARRMEAAREVEDYDRADAIGKQMDQLEPGASRRSLDAVNRGDEAGAPWGGRRG